MSFEDDGINSISPDGVTFDTGILSTIINDEDTTEGEKYRLAHVFERIARNIRDVPRYTYASEESYCLPKWRGRSFRKPKIPKSVSENIFFITVIWQCLCVLSLEVVDEITDQRSERKKNPYFIAGLFVIVTLYISNVILCFSVNVKLLKQYKHKNTSMKFLLYSYISILVLFGGMYTFTAWVLPESFANITCKHKSFVVLHLYTQLLFVSISTGTLCGATNVTASHVLTELMMSFQMLLSFLHFASIISEVLHPSVPDLKSQRKVKHRSREKCNKTNGNLIFQEKRKKNRMQTMLDV